MARAEVTVATVESRERIMREIEGTSMGEAVGGAGAVVLSILGLIGVKAGLLASVATIAEGVAFMVGGAAIASQYSHLLGKMEVTRPRHATRGAMGMEMLAGISAIVLGVLALLRIDPSVLLSISAIILGAALLMSSSAVTHLESLAVWSGAKDGPNDSSEMVEILGGSDILIGVAAVVLGILALLGNSPMTLTLVALLTMGAAVLLNASWLTAKILRIFG